MMTLERLSIVINHVSICKKKFQAEGGRISETVRDRAKVAIIH